nr:hypothetical protein [Armatimonas sp.]
MNNNLGKTVLFRMNRRILAVHQLVLATTATLLIALFAVKAQSETPGKMDAKQHFDPKMLEPVTKSAPMPPPLRWNTSPKEPKPTLIETISTPSSGPSLRNMIRAFTIF